MVIEYNVRQIWSADHFADVTSDLFFLYIFETNKYIHSIVVLNV